MIFGFIIRENSDVEPPHFTEEIESPEDLEHKCFLQGGAQHCRGCYWEGVCDQQDSYEYEREEIL